MSTKKMKILIPIIGLFLILILSAYDKGKGTGGLYILRREIPFLSSNKYNDKYVKLGKKLFYDSILSETRSFDCSGCHLPKFSFADTVPFSNSLLTKDKLTYNTPGLVNLAFSRSYGWEGKHTVLEEYITYHLSDSSIMNLNSRLTVQRLSEDSAYSVYLKKTLKFNTIDSALVTNALAQYLRTIIAINTKFEVKLWNEGLIAKSDSIIFGTVFKTMSPRFRYALNLCVTCHSGQSVKSGFMTNIGLDATDRFKYRIPAIKNLQHTGPYMHDGRFKTLEAVVEHYNSGIKYNESLDNLLKVKGKNEAIRLNLNKTEKKQLVDYLNSLFDPQYRTIYDLYKDKETPLKGN
ncbi:MAG: hypothetical protein IPM95_02440 [Sphingobacteriales bacterium]|nr:hypothetical protein [Sphingobacteriales bacterium]